MSCAIQRRYSSLLLQIAVLLAACHIRAAQHPTTSATSFPYEIEWRVPVGCDFSGFFVEVALGFVPFLAERLPAVWLLHERCSDAFLSRQLTKAEAESYRRLQRWDNTRSSEQTEAAIAIEHGAACLARHWRHGQPGRPVYVIARSMTEGVLPRAEAACLLERDFNELWVPTEQHIEIYVAGGIARSRLLVMPEAVATDFWRRELAPADEVAAWKAASIAAAARTHELATSAAAKPRVFVSVFKWEARKGWDVLLSAYWSEFRVSKATRASARRAGKLVPRSNEHVLLRLRSYVPHWEPAPRDILAQLRRYAAKQPGRPNLEELPPVEIIDRELSREQMRTMYAAADAFVLPTRGEGWCLPAMEAMSMGLPPIITNHSGPTAYITQENAFPLSYTDGHAGQASPNLAHLRKLMRQVVENPAEASARGARARNDIIAKFSSTAVIDRVEARLRSIGADLQEARGVQSAQDWETANANAARSSRIETEVQRADTQSQSTNEDVVSQVSPAHEVQKVTVQRVNKDIQAQPSSAMHTENAEQSETSTRSNSKVSSEHLERSIQKNSEAAISGSTSQRDGENGLRLAEGTFFWASLASNIVMACAWLWILQHREQLAFQRWKAR